MKTLIVVKGVPQAGGRYCARRPFRDRGRRISAPADRAGETTGSRPREQASRVGRAIRKERATGLTGAAADTRRCTGWFAAPEEYAGYEVLDARYRRMGRVGELLVDAVGEPAYVRVRFGWLGLRSALIPARAVWVDRRRRVLVLHQRTSRGGRVAGPPGG